MGLIGLLDIWQDTTISRFHLLAYIAFLKEIIIIVFLLIKRYAKQVSGHRIQTDVKFLNFQKDGKSIRRYQYTAIDDSTRARALRIYERHNQANAIDFMNYVIERFSFRIHAVQTDNGHEFQVKFHWYLEDLGMRHVYIKPRTPGSRAFSWN